jgi:hypothetical protein
MKEQRDSLIFYRSFYDAIKELTPLQQWEVYNAIFQYWLDFKDPELSWVSKIIFTLIKPQLEANIKKYINWNKQKQSKTEAKQKQNISKDESKHKQSRSKTEGNVNDNDNDNDNIYRTKDGFYKKEIKEELENVIEHWNNIFKEKRQVTNDLLKYYKILRKKYSYDEFKKWFSNYCKSKVDIEQKYRLSPIWFMKQSNGFISYL